MNIILFQPNKMQNNTFILISVLVIFGLFVIGGCSIKCNDNRDGFSQKGSCPNGTINFCPPDFGGYKAPCQCSPEFCSKLNCGDDGKCICMHVGNDPDGKPINRCWCVPKHIAAPLKPGSKIFIPIVNPNNY